MKNYKVTITEPADNDLQEISEYIEKEIREPVAA